MSRRRQIYVLLTVLTLSLFAIPTAARQFIQGERCTVPEGETIVGTLFVFCQSLTIDGNLDGNLIGAAVNTEVRGTITDSVYLVGGQMDLYGALGDDLHYGGVVLNIHQPSTFATDYSDVFSLTMSTRQDPTTYIPGSVVSVGYQLLLEGDVGGEVSFWGAALEIVGQVAGDVTADVGDAQDSEGTAQLETLFLPLPVTLSLVDPGLRVAETAEINGLLRYRSPTPGDVAANTIIGPIAFEAVAQQTQIADLTDEETFWQEVRRYGAASLREFVTLAVVGGLGLLFVPKLTQAPIRNLRQRPLTSLGVGTLTFLLSFPVVVIVIVISLLLIFSLSLLQAGNLTIAGIVVVILLNVGGASLFYFVAIFVARSIVCLALGRRLLRLVFEDDGKIRFLYLGLVLGSVLVALVVSLPLIGWLANALTLFLGLGAIVNLVQVELRSIREGNLYGAADTPPSANRPYNVSVEPPLLAEKVAPRPRRPRPRHTVGTDNLPEGFVWWDDM
jgi:hypothetical protein